MRNVNVLLRPLAATICNLLMIYVVYFLARIIYLLVNFSYFDKPFFEGMFGEFYFPDGTKPIWESLSWLQKEFMQWFSIGRRANSTNRFAVGSL